MGSRCWIAGKYGEGVEVSNAADERAAAWMKGLAGNLVLVMAGSEGRVPRVRLRGEARR